MVAAVRALEPRRVDTEDDDILLPFVVRTARRCDAISPAEAFTDAIIYLPVHVRRCLPSSACMHG